MAALHAKQSLRVWLRMLGATTIMQKLIQNYLKVRFDSTLPRFDVMSALDRQDGPITMSELSDKLLVSNGNVSGLVSRLVKDGMMTREVDPHDRRTQRVELSSTGREAFHAMAIEHEKLVDSLFSDLSDAQMEELLHLTTILNATLHAKRKPPEKP
jgi:DNA-binding MarR family transcriptional regulator